LIVVDASVLAVALADDGEDGDLTRAELATARRLSAPQVVDLEVTSVWRRAARSGRLEPRRAALAFADLERLPLRRVAHSPLLPRIWELRDTVTAYDAAYVALAELLAAPLLTADARLAGAPGPRCDFRLVGGA
jgi:predicted nucleic acid-binding protein